MVQSLHEVLFQNGLLSSKRVPQKIEENKSCRKTLDLQILFCSFSVHAYDSSKKATKLAKKGPKLEAFTVPLMSCWQDPKRLQKEEKRRRRAKQKKQELKELKKQRKQEEKSRAVTEEEVASTYTGLDREMAEEFISVSMEPGRTINRVMNHSDNDQENENEIVVCDERNPNHSFDSSRVRPYRD
jgi:hypothetical protein